MSEFKFRDENVTVIRGSQFRRFEGIMQSLLESGNLHLQGQNVGREKGLVRHCMGVSLYGRGVGPDVYKVGRVEYWQPPHRSAPLDDCLIAFSDRHALVIEYPLADARDAERREGAIHDVLMEFTQREDRYLGLHPYRYQPISVEVPTTLLYPLFPLAARFGIRSPLDELCTHRSMLRVYFTLRRKPTPEETAEAEAAEQQAEQWETDPAAYAQETVEAES